MQLTSMSVRVIVRLCGSDAMEDIPALLCLLLTVRLERSLSPNSRLL